MLNKKHVEASIKSDIIKTYDVGKVFFALMKHKTTNNAS